MKLLKKSSVIDKPSDKLCPKLFIGNRLLPGIRKKILDIIFNEFVRFNNVENWLQDIVIGGSYTTNQYREDSDLDIGVLINFERFLKENPEFKTTAFVYFFINNSIIQKLNKAKIKINGISVVFMLARRGKEYPSPGLYSVLYDYWIREPFFFPLELDPEKVFSVYKIIAFLLYKLLNFLLLLKNGDKIVKRIINKMERDRQIINLQQGDFNELNLIYKFLEERFGLERFKKIR